MTGLIARKNRQGVRITVAVATIGIRGTHFEGEVTERQEKDGKTVDASAKVALLEPEGSDAGNAIVVENKFGSVVIDKPGFGTEIPDEKSPPSPVKRMQLRTIDNLLRVLRTPARTGGPARRPYPQDGATQRPPRCRRHARLDLQRHADRGGEAAGGVYEGVRGEAGVTASSVVAAATRCNLPGKPAPKVRV